MCALSEPVDRPVVRIEVKDAIASPADAGRWVRDAWDRATGPLR